LRYMNLILLSGKTLSFILGDMAFYFSMLCEYGTNLMCNIWTQEKTMQD